MLKLENVSFSYGKKRVIKDLSAEINANEFIGIIGPNGSGKSTLLKLISGLLQPREGRIFINGKNIKHIPVDIYAKTVSYLPSGLEIYFPYTVEEFVSMGRFPHTGRYGKLKKSDRHIIETTLEDFEIKSYSKRNMMELSDGEKQRVFLAQAIVQTPCFLLMDEPTSHLDIGYSYKILDEVKKLNHGELTVISVLHDLNLASEYCTRLFLIDGGEITSSGIPEEVITYGNIEKAYKTRVLVYNNPYSGKPHVFGIPSRLLNN